MDERIGDWVIETRLGQGGMGSVYRCHNALAPRIRAAVKVVFGGPDADFQERFVREVEALEGLQHPTIVRVKGWGETPDGRLWLAMDLVEGQDLQQRLRAGPLDAPDARKVFADLAAALAHAHAKDVFHRDIKPANLLLDAHGNARLVDFGIAVQDGRTRLSSAGIVSGTPAYLAPEVFGGVPEPQKLDVYAFGQMLYEALVGEPAFPDPEGLTTTASIAHVAGRKLQAAPLDPGPGFPDDLREIVRRTTAPQPTSRFTDLSAVEAALRGEAPLPAPTSNATLAFGLDDLELDAPKPERPPEPPYVPSDERAVPPPVPVPVAPTRSWGPLLGGLTVVLLLIGLLITLLWPRPYDVEVVLTGLAADTPVHVRFDGIPTGTQGLRHVRENVTGPVHVQVMAGEHCDLTADPGQCPTCCACIEQTIEAPLTAIELRQDRSPTRLEVTVQAPTSPVVTLDGQLLHPTDGVHSTDSTPGPHTLVAELGTCPPEARGCGDDCPAGCRSVQQTVELTCHTTQTVPLVLQAPKEPDKPVSPLSGKKVRILHRVGHVDTADRVAASLRSRGAIVEVRLIMQVREEEFGKVIPFGEGNVRAAKAAHRLAARHSYSEVRATAQTSDDIDIAVWVRNRR